MIKIQIKSILGSVLFEYEKKNNTTKDTLVEAVNRRANLIGADLRRANLSGAYLSGAKYIPYIPMSCPSDGAFIAWKKVSDCLIKLEIPDDAKRSSATTNKCRCDKAKVLEIITLNDKRSVEEVVNKHYIPNITYKVGEMVYPDSFDDNRWNECSHGIHFFIDKQDAINY